REDLEVLRDLDAPADDQRVVEGATVASDEDRIVRVIGLQVDVGGDDTESGGVFLFARLELDRVEEIVEAGNLLAAGGIPDDELDVVGPDLDRQVVEAVGAGLEVERLVGR